MAVFSRCEAVLVAMSQELDAGWCLVEHVPADFLKALWLSLLASEAAQARQRKEHFGAVGV